MGRPSGLVQTRHRRGRWSRTNLRLALQLALAVFAIATAAALSAGVVHVIERPVSPFEPVSDQELHAAPVTAGETLEPDSMSEAPPANAVLPTAG